MTQRETIDTTYADLRPSDLVIDKSGQAWPITENKHDVVLGAVGFWLLDPVTKVRMHFVTKTATDAVKVSRLPTQADEAAKLEAEFPATVGRLSTSPEERAELQEKFPKDWAPAGTVNDSYLPDSHASMTDAVANVMEYFKEATVEAEVTAAEVDAAAAATDDAPLTIIPFADMTPLEALVTLYLLHGVYGHDMVSKVELSQLHDQAHAATATLNSRHVPHVHEVK